MPFLKGNIQNWQGREMAFHVPQVLTTLNHNEKFPQGSKISKNLAFKIGMGSNSGAVPY